MGRRTGPASAAFDACLVLHGHIVHFVRDMVREAFDLSAIFDSYGGERGYPPYHPGMMVALLLYGCSRGLYSSR
jgi:transposase